MMAGNFNQNDAALISSLSNEIEGLGGSYIWRYILDLSMATDFCCGSFGIPLCSTDDNFWKVVDRQKI